MVMALECLVEAFGGGAKAWPGLAWLSLLEAWLGPPGNL